MAFFKRLYHKMLYWSQHRQAPYYLGGVSFVEASFFPVPPDVMLIPMVLSHPQKGWYYAWITILFSIIGGLFGYFIGYYAYTLLAEPFIVTFHYEQLYNAVATWFDKYGVFAVALAGFTPIPYKLFTIAAGATDMPWMGFLLASCVGRGLRFLGVVAFVKYVGVKIEPVIVKYLEWIGWGTLLLITIGVVWYWYA